MSLQKSRPLKFNIPCTFHTIVEVSLNFRKLPVFDGETMVKPGSNSKVFICGYESAERYAAGDAFTYAHTVDIPFMTAIEAVRQTEKTCERFCWDWIQANIPFYSDAVWVDG